MTGTPARTESKKRFIRVLKDLWRGRVTRWVVLGVVVYILVLQYVFAQIAVQFGIDWPMIFWVTLVDTCEFFEACTSEQTNNGVPYEKE